MRLRGPSKDMMFSAVWFGLSVLACCSLAGPVGRLLGVIDYPDGGRKSHARPTPMIGGIALMVPLLLVALVGSQLVQRATRRSLRCSCWSAAGSCARLVR